MYKYPYGDSQQLNLDWILAKLKELETAGLGLDLEEVSNALISLTYNTSTAYRRYDYAFLNGKLYRCLSDTSGAFDPAAWQEALIGDDLAVLTRWINAIDAAAVVDVKFDTSGTNGKLQQKYHDQYHDVVEVDYSPVQNSKRPLSSNAGYELNDTLNIRALLTASNRLDNKAATSTIDGVTFTVNSDKTVTLNGLSSGWTGLLLNTFTLDAGDYILKSGIAEYPLNYDCYLEIKDGNTTITNTASKYESPFTIATPTTVSVRVHARPDINFSNAKVYPEIKCKGDNANYTPYAPSNSELNGAISDVQGQISAYVENGNTASRKYIVGDYVVWKGDLYIVKSTINSGSNFTSSNLESTSVTKAMAYRVGDVITPSAVYTCQFAAQWVQNNQLRFLIPLSKPISANNITVSGVSYARYYNPSTNAYVRVDADLSDSTVVTVETKNTGFGVGFHLTYSSNVGLINAIAVVQISNLVITFS